jgi:hypothetical protein
MIGPRRLQIGEIGRSRAMANGESRMASNESEYWLIESGASSGFDAIRALVNRINPAADDYDQARLAGLHKTVADVFSDFNPDADDLEYGEAGREFMRLVASNRPSDKLGLDEAAIQDLREQIGKVALYVLGKPERGAKLIVAGRKLLGAPSQAMLLYRGALATIVVLFEDVVAQLLRAYYRRYPQAISSEKTLTLGELNSVDSIEAARELIVEREIDAVLRRGLLEQMDHFHNRLKIGPEAPTGLTARFIEVVERRNLFVHNQGRVDRRYLDSVPAAISAKFQAQPGKDLLLSEEYLLEAIDIADALSLRLIGSCWRKWSSSQGADLFLQLRIQDALAARRYRLFKDLAAYVRSLDRPSDLFSGLCALQGALDLRETGDTAAMRQLLGQIDWAAAPRVFVLAVHLLLNEREEFEQLLRTSIEAGDVTMPEIEEWPWFAWRGDEWFEAALARIKAALVVSDTRPTPEEP